jgi:hypothetical protein
VIRRKPLQSILIVFLSVFLLLPEQIMDAVLCIRADGHISIEAAENGRCGFLAVPASGPSPEQRTELSSSTDDHGPCIDVPLLASADVDSGPLVSPLTALLKLQVPVLTLGAFVTPVSAESSQQYSGLPPPSSRCSLLALRTVVLLL